MESDETMADGYTVSTITGPPVFFETRPFSYSTTISTEYAPSGTVWPPSALPSQTIVSVHRDPSNALTVRFVLRLVIRRLHFARPSLVTASRVNVLVSKTLSPFGENAFCADRTKTGDWLVSIKIPPDSAPPVFPAASVALMLKRYRPSATRVFLSSFPSHVKSPGFPSNRAVFTVLPSL